MGGGLHDVWTVSRSLCTPAAVFASEGEPLELLLPLAHLPQLVIVCLRALTGTMRIHGTHATASLHPTLWPRLPCWEEAAPAFVRAMKSVCFSSCFETAAASNLRHGPVSTKPWKSAKLRARLCGVPGRPLGDGLNVLRVGACVVFEPLVSKEDHVSADGVEESLIVRDGHSRPLAPACIRAEPVAEPEHASDVEMVGRLIEQ